ncbi:HAMP domain-containing protein [Heliobacillus mobilis]|uniref:histidine kinase n=1 Tax=Heliobacterium mobile TaxID=28064 RepID=A0A6I3SH82_HELMO|nr:HAMP domain-containing sensor histidine kinase [Heliobacterium mobile]MTV48209.1 HAMP domain-containing protein [Heliobacterium mobile]
MRDSLKLKLFVSMSLLILFFVFFSWFLVSTSLGKYYVYQKKSSLYDIGNEVTRLVSNSITDAWTDLERLERTNGVQIIITDENQTIKYISLPQFGPGNPFKEEILPKPFNDQPPTSMNRPATHIKTLADAPPAVPPNEMDLPPERSNRESPTSPPRDKRLQLLIQAVETYQSLLNDEKAVIIEQYDARLNVQFLNYIKRLPNGDYLFLGTPLTAIEESAAVANRFFVYTGIITLLIGNLFLYFFAGRITKPLLEMNEIAKGMARLDFQQKVASHGDDELGQLAQSINSLSDQLSASISELQEKNKQLESDIERERKIDEMRREFVSNVSHELKTPLALIQGYAEGLKVNVIEDEESKQFYCDVIMDESHKMDKLVKELLDLSQIESGQMRLDITRFDAGAWAARMMEKYAPLFREQQIQWRLETEPELYVEADLTRSEQVLSNYLTNAIRHIESPKVLQVKLVPVDEKIRVSLFNTGKQIPESELEKIWTSFYKIDKARTRALGGTGLGLSIVSAIQRLHHNKYGVENVPGGVVFWFDLNRAVDTKVCGNGVDDEEKPFMGQ